MARWVLQSLQYRCSVAGVTAREPSSWIQSLVQSVRPAEVSRYGFRNPTLPSAVSSAPWCSRSRLRRPQSSSRSNALVESDHPLEFLPAKPSRRAETNRPLSWTFAPYSTCRIRGSTYAGFACPLRSAPRVWPPSRRLAPREPAPALFHADSAPGIPPSELSPLGRYPDVTTGERPPTVSPAVVPTAEATGRTDGPRFLGFDPSESPSRPNVCLARQPPDAPLGFTLPGSTNQRLGPDFAGPPLTRFANRTTHAPPADASEFRSTLVWLLPAAVQARRLDKATHLGFPHRHNPCRSGEPPSGL